MSDDTGLSAWVKDIDEKQDEAIGLLRELVVEIRHIKERMDKQCTRIEQVENRVKDLESHRDKVMGELSGIKWLIVIGVTGAAALAAVIPAVIKWIQSV